MCQWEIQTHFHKVFCTRYDVSLLIERWTLIFVTVIPKYFNFATISKDIIQLYVIYHMRLFLNVFGNDTNRIGIHD
jgi:hypothetical protein